MSKTGFKKNLSHVYKKINSSENEANFRENNSV